MSRYKFQSASQSDLPLPPSLLIITKPFDIANTRFSADRHYRYTLFRDVRPEGAPGEPKTYLAVIGLNPSGADETREDNSVGRCISFARRWGFEALYMLNAFALRATDPKELYQHPDPIGPDNDRWIREIVVGAGRVIPAWGQHAMKLKRAADVEAIVQAACRPEVVLCFGRNKDLSPKHPLYQPNDVVPVPYFRSELPY